MIDSSACVAISPIVKPISLKLPMPPDTSVPYCLRIALYRFIVGVVVSSGSASSAFTKNLPSHFDPSDWARKSVLHGVEQAQP